MFTSRVVAAGDYVRRADVSLRTVVLDRPEEGAAIVRAMARQGWWSHSLAGPVPHRVLAGLRADALIVDPSVGARGMWPWLMSLPAALPGLAIVVCTGPSTVRQRVRALRSGIDGWLSKPVDLAELAATVESVVRHDPAWRREARGPVVRAGELEIELGGYCCRAGGQVLHLSVREFDVLAGLAARRGRVVERAQLYLEVWQGEMAERDRSVDVYIRKLRVKLAAGSPGWRYLHTHVQRGYRFEARRLVPATPATR